MLKWIAALSMLIDHIGFFFYDQIPPQLYECMRGFGRLAMPLFAFSLAFGFIHSKNWLKYFLRLFTFAFISEFAFRKIYELNNFYYSGINIIFTFSFSLVFLIALKILINSGYDLLVRMQPIQSGGAQDENLPFHFRINLGFELSPFFGLILGLVFMLISVFCIVYYDTEYGLYGLLMVVAFYILESIEFKNPTLMAYLLIIVVNLIFQLPGWLGKSTLHNYNSLQWLTVFAVPIYLHRKDEPKPPKWQKYFFYIFYPAHFVLLGLIRYYFF
ncbi:MAG: hypothetical protein GX326_00525 [Clostridiaceae bacterium]|nr:hypothetical protein [Clostridiaceae bacterium]